MRTQVWRLPAEELSCDVPLLIADGHHRYETAVAFREEDPPRRTRSPCSSRARSPGSRSSRRTGVARSINSEPEGFMTLELGPVVARRSTADGELLPASTAHDELDTQAVERFEPDGVTYTPYADEAIAAVDDGEADSAFLVRAPTIAQVAEFAARGETMPQKSTYFFPKLTSGLLLFSPL